MIASEEVFLDHAASTPLRPVARRAWLDAADAHHANPTGAHLAARDARRALDRAREQVAAALGASPGEVVFTSGGSEADNMAILGAVRSGVRGAAAVAPAALSGAEDGGAVASCAPGAVAVTTAAEHHAVLDPVQRSGGLIAGVDARGIVDCGALTETLRAHPDVAVVSVIAVNNEIGSITPLRQVAGIVRELAPTALLHTDAVQAVNWIDVAAECGDFDLVSVTGHKVGAPVGTGALIVRDGVELDPLIVGGGQERGRRAGTPDVAGAVAFAAALLEAVEQRDESVARLELLRDGLIDGLIDRLGDRVIVSAARHDEGRGHIAAGIANVCLADVQSEALLFVIDAAGVRASAASSCSSGAQDPSHVLAAIGVPRELALGSLRLSLGHTSSACDVERAVDVIAESVHRLDRFDGG